ncbi:hypothetical protein T4A_7008 [Trichinella pseudospiralis]|uniref:Uncharacterized protein n=1 Tax=Trichinella pseudospiralis TaxID=6337 RepID=A0A0V1DWW3_TRIPS|nr:hypothetical protein T4A_7008 [Trichinella pseudospiralis]
MSDMRFFWTSYFSFNWVSLDAISANLNRSSTQMNRVPRLSVHSDGILTNVTSMNMLLRSHYSRVTNYMKMVENVSCIQNGRVVRRALFPYFYCLNYKCDEMR